MMISIHLRVSRGLSVSHTSHSITRNTLLLSNLAKNHQPRHSPWLIQVHQLRPSVMLKNTPTRDLLFRHWGPFTIACTHFSWWRVLSSVMKRKRNTDRDRDKKKEWRNEREENGEKSKRDEPKDEGKSEQRKKCWKKMLKGTKWNKKGTQQKQKMKAFWLNFFCGLKWRERRI